VIETVMDRALRMRTKVGSNFWEVSLSDLQVIVCPDNRNAQCDQIRLYFSVVANFETVYIAIGEFLGSLG